jgi:hypothetical protein
MEKYEYETPLRDDYMKTAKISTGTGYHISFKFCKNLAEIFSVMHVN